MAKPNTSPGLKARAGVRGCCLLALLAVQPVVGQRAGLLDRATPSYLEFSDPHFQVAENASNAVITVIRTGEYREPAVVDYTTEDGTATAGEDYHAVSGTLLIPAGAGITTFLVPILKDVAEEESETVLLKLSTTGHNAMVTRGSATLTIVPSQPIVPTDLPVLLTVQSDGADHVIVSWPSTRQDCLLEKSEDPYGATWFRVRAPVAISNGQYEVREPVIPGKCFYRLRVD